MQALLTANALHYEDTLATKVRICQQRPTPTLRTSLHPPIRPTPQARNGEIYSFHNEFTCYLHPYLSISLSTPCISIHLWSANIYTRGRFCFWFAREILVNQGITEPVSNGRTLGVVGRLLGPCSGWAKVWLTVGQDFTSSRFTQSDIRKRSSDSFFTFKNFDS